LFANILGIFIGITNSFIMNIIFNFKVRDKLVQRFLFFYSVGIFGLLLTSGLLYIMVAQLNINTFVSKICTIFVAFIVQYNLNKYISFKNNTKNL
jgi:putative flippase GtrA